MSGLVTSLFGQVCHNYSTMAPSLMMLEALRGNSDEVQRVRKLLKAKEVAKFGWMIYFGKEGQPLARRE